VKVALELALRNQNKAQMFEKAERVIEEIIAKQKEGAKVPTPDDQLGDIFNSFLSEEKLLSLTGAVNLVAIKFLELQVDSRKTGLGDLGRIVPKVQQLKLNNSFVPMVRDLGSGYSQLTVVWMARCSLQDLDGVGSMRNLRELYLAYNEISDLSQLGMLESLEILDLESNEVSDFDQIDYLAMCGSLQQLTLE
jgi:Leucine-rich repeat (LRR) protein